MSVMQNLTEQRDLWEFNCCRDLITITKELRRCANRPHIGDKIRERESLRKFRL